MAKTKRNSSKILDKQIRVDLDFASLIKRIPRERVKKGLEEEFISSREITRMMIRIPEMDLVLDKLINNPRRKKNE